jgi:two-component sensor histidine kinase
LVPCSRATVVEFDREARTARVLATHVDNETVFQTGTLIPPDVLRSELLAQGQIVIDDITGLSDPPLLYKALQVENVRAYLSVPLIAQGDLIGALSMGAERPGVFESRHVDIAREAASSLAVAIRHARLNEQIRQDAETKAILVQEINHRVKNNLSAIIGLLYAEQRHARVDRRTDYPTVMQDLINRIQGLATVHQLLSTSEWSPLLLSELTIHIIHSALQALPSDRYVSVDVSPSPVRVSSKQATSLALVVNELVTNTIKHAFAGRDQAHIVVRITSDDDGIHLRYQDDGPGYPPEVLRLERYNVGLYLVRALVRDDLRGDLVFGNDQGAVANIYFKISVQALSRTSSGTEAMFPSAARGS